MTQNNKKQAGAEQGHTRVGVGSDLGLVWGWVGFGLFLLVDTQGLVCKCAGQALARVIWPASFAENLLFSLFWSRSGQGENNKSQVRFTPLSWAYCVKPMIYTFYTFELVFCAGAKPFKTHQALVCLF